MEPDRCGRIRWIEVLVIIVVLGFLLALLLPGIQSHPPGGRRAHCMNNQCKDVGQRPQDIRYARPSSNHPDGVVATFCDGHTQFISETIDYTVFQEHSVDGCMHPAVDVRLAFGTARIDNRSSRVHRLRIVRAYNTGRS